MDQASTAAPASSWALRAKNFGASAAVVALALLFHRVAGQNRRTLERLFGSEHFSFTGDQFLNAAALCYVALLAMYFLSERNPAVSKSLRFWQLALEFARTPLTLVQRRLSPDDRVAVLATLLKALFGPLMVMALMTATMGFIGNSSMIVQTAAWHLGFRAMFDRYGYWALIQLIILVDVLIFTFGYLVEMPRLRNQIRSVDPTLLGWAAALICYAPFNVVLGTLLGPPGNEFPQFENSTAHFALNTFQLVLMAVYSWASIALGFKASNLTHRGVVGHGPYRFVRHPAYACKNMAWWIGSIPIVSMAFQRSEWDGIQALASVVGWTLLYVLRAVTEEDHLKSVDEEYAAYAAKVRYRFIPGVV